MSGSFFNLATGLVAAIAAKLHSAPVVDLAVLVWAIGVVGLTYVGWALLGLIEPES